MPAGAVADQHGMGAGLNLGADLRRCRFIAQLLAQGVIMAAPIPRSGQIAPNR